QQAAPQQDVSPAEVRALLSDYARLLRLRGERSVLLRREAISALEQMATARAGTGSAPAPASPRSPQRAESPRPTYSEGTPVRSPERTPAPVVATAPAPPSATAVQAPVSNEYEADTRKPQAASVPAIPANQTAAPRAAQTPAAGSKADRLEALRNMVSPCRLCEHLAASRTQTVYGVGNPDCEIMFVGEAPGADEDRKGEPFVGAAGNLLTKMIGAMKLSRDDVYIANVLKCRPDMPVGSSGNRKPTPAEMKTCLPYLKEQISIIKPKVLVALGLTAVEGLRGLAPGSITLSKMRGKFTEFEGIPLMPTFHPAYLLRNQSITEKRKAWEDLLQVMEKVGLPIDDRQRNFFLTPKP
ncbi:MAG: uracil-DNA glycosylase family protein, partial [Candidatus Methylacidiphilales bacterium]